MSDSIGVAGQAVPTVAGATGGSQPPKPRNNKGSAITIKGGRRNVKAYPLTEEELNQLGFLQTSATFLYSLAGTAFGLWVNITQSIEFSKDTPNNVLSHWSSLKLAALVSAVILFFIATVIVIRRRGMLGRIKNETTHD